MKSSYDVIVQEAAQRDLREIWEYLADESFAPVAAARVLDGLYHTIASLKEMPERHALISDGILRKKGVRKLPIAGYIVFYKVNNEEKSVAVLRILHGKQDWEYIL
jgi:toxin ParE1/3/4